MLRLYGKITMKKTSKKNKKSSLHPNNIHIGRYDLAVLSTSVPELADFITTNPTGQATIDFSNAQAVKTLNKALLIHYYDLQFWQLPNNFLCPPIPSRADYIHHIADLISDNQNIIKVLDIGTGANLIYPIIGTHCYHWQFVATDIDPLAIKNAQMICDNNPRLTDTIQLRQQTNADRIFHGIIHKKDRFALTMCNPPFHGSLAEAMASNERKQRNLADNKAKRNPVKTHSTTTKDNPLNFGGQKAELWCKGGEIGFLQRMAVESKDFAKHVKWFTTLVSKSENVAPLQDLLTRLKVKRIKEIPMFHGQKTTRIIAWSFM